MTENLSAYIPMDRRQALTRGNTLPDHMQGVALFADVSGFTPLTETLALELGPKRGAEELSILLNRVLDAIISPVHRFSGSVTGFAGDAILCWFDQDDGTRGAAAAVGIQEAMEAFADVKSPSGTRFSLGIKVAVVSGTVRRFVVGNPEYTLLDVMAGSILEELSVAESQIKRGDIIFNQAIAERLGDNLEIKSWYDNKINGNRYALVSKLNLQLPDAPWPTLEKDAIGAKEARNWLLPPVHERLCSGLGTFLAELRPAVAFFLRFMGIDYDNDKDALTKLDQVVQRVEHTLQKYEASCTHLTVGDKGSYFCVVFGAPIGHEDDALRACAAALEINTELYQLDFIETVQIGITQGKLWAGAYGSTTRRTYDILGDDANLAARLMMAARPGQILVTNRVRNSTADAYNWGESVTVSVKGKTLNIPITPLLGTKKHHASNVRAQSYSLPMVGRNEEKKLIEKILKLAQSGKGQILGITGEAGLGKSRLAAEAISLADEMQFISFMGEAQSYGTNTSYLAWHNILRSFFGVDVSMSRQEQIQKLEDEIRKINPNLTQRLPLLGTVLNISIPENDLTDSLNAKVRKSSLEAMLVECIQARAKTNTILFILEDCHWLDPLSHDLLEVIGRALTNHPILVLMVYRPPELHHLQAPRVNTLPYFTEIDLTEFTPEEADELIKIKLASSFGESIHVSSALLERITTHAAGNPFYIEELLNYLQALNINPTNQEVIETLELPASITSLILSRIDQLTEHEQTTIKVASVIGRLFSAAMIWGIYPNLGDEQKVREFLNTLQQLDLTVLDTPEPEVSYIFKHIFTQEVAYDSLPHATQTMLHETIGKYIERVFSNTLNQFTNILAYHYEHSENKEKKRYYLRKAGEDAQRDYANVAAINYYEKTLPLLEVEEHIDVTLKLGEVHELIGNFQEADKFYNQALSQSKDIGDRKRQAWVEVTFGEFLRKQGRLADASKTLQHADKLFEESGDMAGKGQVLHHMGSIADQNGDFEEATRLTTESLHIRQQLGDKRQIASMLANLGIITARQGQLEKAQSLWEQSLEIRREIGDRWGVANILNNLGFSFLETGDLEAAQTRLEESVAILRELGDRWYIGNALNNLGNVIRDQEEYTSSKEKYNESLLIYRDLGDKWALAYLFEDLAWLAALQKNGQRAVRLRTAASILRDEINSPLTDRETERLNEALRPATDLLNPSELDLAEAEGKTLTLEEAISYALD